MRLATLLLVFAATASAQTGTLDPTFDGDGLRTDSLDIDTILAAVAALPNGEIVSVGWMNADTPQSQQALLLRHAPDGSRIDHQGINHGQFGCHVPEGFYDIALGTGGHAYATGYAQFGCGGPMVDFWTFQLALNGAPERRFERPTFGGAADYARALVVEPDGGVVVAGTARTAPGPENRDVGIARFLADGTLDATYGTGGETLVDVAGDYDLALGAARQPDGKTVVVGFATIEGQSDAFVMRFGTHGVLDPSFGTDGLLTVDAHGFNDAAQAVAVQPDGKVVVAASMTRTDGANRAFVVLRYEADGMPDTSFGADGIVEVEFGGPQAFASGLILQADGKIVVSGTTEQGSGGLETRDFAIARLLADGSLDPTFGTGGIATADVTGGEDGANDLAIQPDGSFVVAGIARMEIDGIPVRKAALARFLGDTPPVANEPSPRDALALAVAPNPARGSTRLWYVLDRTAPVRLAIYDALGREIAVLADGPRQSGGHEVVFDGAGLPAGVYLVRLEASGEVQTLPITLVQ